MAQPDTLAERLFRMRTDARLSQPQLAERMGWGPKSGPPKISKIENGRQMPSANDVRSWAEATGDADEIPELLALLVEMQAVHVGRRKLLSQGGGIEEAPLQDEYDSRIRAATHVRNMEIAMIPGLLQTEPYARSIVEQVRAVFGITDVDAAVRSRMRRQDVLYDTSKEFEFLTTEAALMLMPCPPRVMLGQLHSLLNVGLLDNVTLGIIPFGQLSLTPVNGFLLLDDYLIVETYSGEDQEHGDESEIHRRVFDLLMNEAATGEDARRLITAVADRLREK